MKTDLVPCLMWVKKGAAKHIPDKVEINKEELKQIIEEAKSNEKNGVENEENNSDEDERNSEELCTAKKSNADGDLSEYNLEAYDEDDETVEPSLANLVYYASNKEDPFIASEDDDEDSDREDFLIKPSDNLIILGHVEEDHNSLEVYVYNEEEEDLYIHHDILLSSFPLCVEWLNFDPSEEAPGNYIAVGCITPAIEIWDLDLVDSLEPAFTLGFKKKKKKKKANINSHSDAVLDLSWNKHVRNVLASGSADYTIALWDMNEGKIVTSITQHVEKVQTLEWHPFEAQTLLSGSFDKTAKVFDCRNPTSDFKSWDVSGEVEKVLWNHFDPFYFLAGNDAGLIHYFDVRSTKPVFTLSAHSSSVTGMTLSHQLPGCLITTSSDKSLKVWDIQGNTPEFIIQKLFKMDELLCCQACPDSPLIVALGGQKLKKSFTVWDMKESNAVRKRFHGRRSCVQTIISTGSSTSQDPVKMDTTNEH